MEVFLGRACTCVSGSRPSACDYSEEFLASSVHSITQAPMSRRRCVREEQAEARKRSEEMDGGRSHKSPGQMRAGTCWECLPHPHVFSWTRARNTAISGWCPLCQHWKQEERLVAPPKKYFNSIKEGKSLLEKWSLPQWMFLKLDNHLERLDEIVERLLRKNRNWNQKISKPFLFMHLLRSHFN